MPTPSPPPPPDPARASDASPGACAPRSLFAGWNSASALAVLAVNVLPVVAVLWIGWTVGQLLFLYWFECGVIGLYTAARMLWLGRVAAIPWVVLFFSHFGAFMGMLLLIIALLVSGIMFAPEGTEAKVEAPTGFWAGPFFFWLSVGALFVSHGVAFAQEVLRPADPRVDYRFLMILPYARIVLMQLVAILGALLARALGSPVGLLVLLIVLKTATDLVSHLFTQRCDADAAFRPALAGPDAGRGPKAQG